MLFRFIAGSFVTRLAGFGCTGLGFWLIYRGFSDENTAAGIAWGIGGAVLILGGLYLAVSLARRPSYPGDAETGPPAATLPEEVVPIDPVHGSDQGG